MLKNHSYKQPDIITFSIAHLNYHYFYLFVTFLICLILWPQKQHGLLCSLDQSEFYFHQSPTHNDNEKNDVQMLLTSFKGTKELNCSSSSSLLRVYNQ